jgi:peptide-methionine (S)-S-oxide reductase
MMQPLHKEYQRSTPLEQASPGDVVTIQLDLTPENGFVPETLFDTSGKLSFVLGWGNFLPGLHELIDGMSVGEELSGVSIDAGWGERNPDLIIQVPKSNLKKMKSIENITEGAVLNLQGGIQVSVIQVTGDTIIVDANPPLAGSSYSCSLKVLNIDPFPTSKLQYQGSKSSTEEESKNFEVATFAMGCFWGGELAFMRVPGVVGTRVGYTQGLTQNPTYEEVSQGNTKHREALMVVYDPRVVSYSELVRVFMDRLAATISQYKIELFHDEYTSLQYQHGIYYNNDEQRCKAEEAIASNNNSYKVEVNPAAVFYDAEEYHQQYLLKGGQSARKEAKETIRCFG